MDYNYYSAPTNAGSAFGGIFALVCWLFICLLSLASLGFTIWMIVDVAKANYPKEKENEKLIWIILMLFTGIIGSAIYYFVQRPKYRSVSSSSPTTPSPEPSKTIEVKPIEVEEKTPRAKKSSKTAR